MVSKERLGIVLGCVAALALTALVGASSASAQCKTLTFQRGPYDTFGPLYEKLYWQPELKEALGCAVSDYTFVEAPRGAWVMYEHGMILFSPQVRQANAVYGAIGDLYRLWLVYGDGLNSIGYPTTDELPGADGGRYSLFQHAGIWWHPSDGRALTVYGDIFQSYLEVGAEAAKGYPMGEETDGDGWFCLPGQRQQLFGHFVYACWDPETREVSWSK